MGQFMRGSSRGARTAWLGKVTVKASERAIIFSLGGKPRTVVGPKRVRLYFATVIFLDRRIASEFECVAAARRRFSFPVACESRHCAEVCAAAAPRALAV
jgi:hypothetical protein